MDFSKNKICRSCLSEDELESVFGVTTFEHNELLFSEMLMECTTVKIKENDILPHKICQTCIEHLKQTYAFKKQCETVDTVLRLHIEMQENREDKLERVKSESLFYFSGIENEKIATPVIIESQSVSQNESDKNFTLEENSDYTPMELSSTFCIAPDVVKEENAQTNLENVNEKPINSAVELEMLNENIEIWDINETTEALELQELSNGNDTQIILVEESDHSDLSKLNRNKVTVWKSCVKCDITFNTRYLYVKHLMHVHGEARSPCKVCGKSFQKQSALRNHFKTHLHSQYFHSCRTCGHKFTRLSDLCKHKSMHCGAKNEGHFPCKICGRTFTKLIRLRHHNLIHTDEKPHACHFCGKKFRLRNTLKYHYTVHLKEAQFVCEYCSKPYRTKKSVMAHIKRMHPQPEQKQNDRSHLGNNFYYDDEHNLYVCCICGRGFSSEIIVKEHCVRHRIQKKCDKCEEFFNNKSELVKHKHLQHGDTIYNCFQCDKIFLSNAILKKHSIVHSGEKLFSCEKCGLRFAYRGNLNRHIKTHNGLKPYKCHVCLKSFTQGPALAEHIERMHAERKTPLNCQYCDKIYYTAGSLKSHHYSKHMNKMSKTKSDKLQPDETLCNICGKSFSNKNSLKQHHKCIHGDKKRYECTVCGNGYATKAHLGRHTNMHNGIKPYACSICKRRFSQLGNMKTHHLTHTGVKPFKCEICERRFTQRQQLMSHIRTHTGEKPYSCTVCGRNFAHKLNLDVHYRIHTGETPYHCAFCEKGFKSSNNMKKHQRVHLNK